MTTRPARAARRRDLERLAAHLGADLALGDDAPQRGCGAGGRWCSSGDLPEDLGQGLTDAGDLDDRARARPRCAASSAAVEAVEGEQGDRAVDVVDADAAHVAQPGGVAAVELDAVALGALAAQLVDGAGGDDPARRTARPGRRRAARPGRAGGWRTAAARRRPRARSRSTIASTASGSRPLNGSSSTRAVGPVHQRGGDLHALLVAQRERRRAGRRARSARPKKLEQLVGPGARRRGRRSRAAGRRRPAARRASSAGRGRAPRACSRSVRRSSAVIGAAVPEHLAAGGRRARP